MQVEGTEGQSQKVWYRCTRCKHSALIERSSLAQNKNGNHEKIERNACIMYSKELVFSIGQAIYHSEWDDVGKVVSKQKTSDGTHAITVSFEKLGERKLIENVLPSLESEIMETVPSHV